MEDYSEMVRRHQDRVYSLCLSFLHNPTEAEDAAQEIFLKAYRALSSFRFDSSFSTWIYRITHRHCLDLIKAKNRRPTESLDARNDDFGETLSTQEPPPDDSNADLVRRILNELPDEQRTVLVLRESQGLTYEEISLVLGIGLEAVKSRLRRARESFCVSGRHFLTDPIVQRIERENSGERP